MPRPKKTVKNGAAKGTVELKKVGEKPEIVETGESMTKEEFDKKVSKTSTPKKRRRLVLDRTKMEEVEKYVKEGKKVQVMGIGTGRKYIVFLEGD